MKQRWMIAAGVACCGMACSAGATPAVGRGLGTKSTEGDEFILIPWDMGRAERDDRKPLLRFPAGSQGSLQITEKVWEERGKRAPWWKDYTLDHTRFSVTIRRDSIRNSILISSGSPELAFIIPGENLMIKEMGIEETISVPESSDDLDLEGRYSRRDLSGDFVFTFAPVIRSFVAPDDLLISCQNTGKFIGLACRFKDQIDKYTSVSFSPIFFEGDARSLRNMIEAGVLAFAQKIERNTQHAFRCHVSDGTHVAQWNRLRNGSEQWGITTSEKGSANGLSPGSLFPEQRTQESNLVFSGVVSTRGHVPTFDPSGHYDVSRNPASLPVELRAAQALWALTRKLVAPFSLEEGRLLAFRYRDEIWVAGG